MKAVHNKYTWALISILVLIMTSYTNSWAQPEAANTTCVRSFFSELLGEWVGTCEQQMEDQEPDRQYFHAVLKKLDDGSFEGKFKFFRKGENGLVPSGETCVVTGFDCNGCAVSKITGTGKVRVFDKLTDQQHELAETLSYTEGEGLQSQGTGSISVSGMPFGLGKNGKVKESESVWSIKDGKLTIEQQMRVSFKALFVTQSFDVESRYTARRGSDVTAVLEDKTQTPSAQPGGYGAGASSDD